MRADANRALDLQTAESLYALTRLPEVDGARAIGLAARFGSWQALLGAGPADLPAAADAVVDAHRAAVGTDATGSTAARLVGWFDSTYPEGLRDLEDPPAVLWVRGDLGPTPRLAVVGTRTPTAWGLRMADRVATAAAARGVPVVSGLAFGIDIAAHQAVLREGGRTVAVLGGGADAPSPREHAEQAARILAAGGALVAEVPPGTTPTPRTLVARDRIQAALARATVMVQCDLASGAMHTARFTVALGRALVVAVPPDAEAEAAENAGNQAMLRPAAEDDAPRATTALRSVSDVDALFELLVP
jgi:DNA processing protein